MSKVTVFGTGYVGCVTAACLSRDGHDVTGVDIDPDKIAAINAGRSTVSEPGVDEIVAQQVAAGRLRATLHTGEAMRDADVAIICVGTPSQEDGSVDTGSLESVVRSIGESLKTSQQPCTIVVRSTLMPGVLETRLATLLETSAGKRLGSQIRLCNNPEFLRESSAVQDYDQPPFILVGAASATEAEPVINLYAGIDAERIVTDTRTAALVKYASNAFHAAKIAFANEIGSLARSLEADGHEVMRLLCLDRKLNISPAYLRPGFAFGGSCLPKDLRALVRHAQQNAMRTDLLAATLSSNEEHLRWVERLVQKTGCRRIGLVGLTFKAGTDDLRESPQVILAESLLGKGHSLKIYDPGLSLSRLRGRNLAYVDRHLPHLAALLADRPESLCEHADLIILCTGVADEYPWRNNFSGQILDLRRDLACQPRSDLRLNSQVENTSTPPTEQ